MKHKLALSLLVLGGVLMSGQRAAAEYKLNFKPGFDISYEGGNNAYFWNLFADQRQLENTEGADAGSNAGTYASRPNPYAGANQVARYPQGYPQYYGGYQVATYPQGYPQRGPAVPMYTVGYSPYARPVAVPYPYYYPSSMPNAYWYGR